MDPRKATVAILYNGVKAEVQLAPYLSSFKYTDVASGSSDSIASGSTAGSPKKGTGCSPP